MITLLLGDSSWILSFYFPQFTPHGIPQLPLTCFPLHEAQRNMNVLGVEGSLGLGEMNGNA